METKILKKGPLRPLMNSIKDVFMRTHFRINALAQPNDSLYFRAAGHRR